MKQNGEYKSEALAALRGNWAPAVLLALVLVLIISIIETPYVLNYMHLVTTDPAAIASSSSLRWLNFVFRAGMLFICGPLMVGISNSYRMILAEGDNRFTSNAFKIGYGRYLRHLWAFFLRNLMVFLWTLLLIVPGIIKALAYAMTFYIIVDDPEIPAGKALALSQEMMRDHKYDLFYLYLSLAGWLFLSILTLGIGLLWFLPYAQTAQASFYQDVKADWLARRAAKEVADAPRLAVEPVASAPGPAGPVSSGSGSVSTSEAGPVSSASENPEDYMPK